MAIDRRRDAGGFLVPEQFVLDLVEYLFWADVLVSMEERAYWDEVDLGLAEVLA